MTKKTLCGAAIALGAALLLATTAACGGAVEEDPTPVLTPKITPASGATRPPATATAAATAAASPTGAAATPTAATTPAGDQTPAGGETPSNGGEETKLTLVAFNILFDKTELEAKAGTVTIEVDNKDGGVPHNVAVHKGSSPSGELVGRTELEAGPVKQTLTLELEAGEYFFTCEVHPTTMSGKLTVS